MKCGRNKIEIATLLPSKIRYTLYIKKETLTIIK